ncbi:restriction endonuclease subunit S [Citrobacter freundii]|uniref:restriction endonuclease subunit S n=1 Tax=Citrobacter freundii TaxID=546 RepID=UPI0015E91123|nr:restriction endonuclease subunit S [Citrobacter freundii]QLY62508.1 restriction endonuclease subunit S [Citrobacter freundii]
MAVEKLIVDHIDTWTTALKTRSTAGRGSSGKIDLYGIKKLRELILELAVRGKLVPQDPNDEPASVLLERIEAEKAELVKQGKIKKPKPLPEISEEEKPFELPVGWEWVRLPEITHYQVGKTPSTKDSSFWGSHENGIPWVSISDLVQNGIVEITSKHISKKAKEDIFKYPPVPAGTILMSFKLTVGKTSLLNIDAYHNEAIISIYEMNGLNRNYLFHLLPLISQLGNTKQAIMGNTLNSESLSMLVVPVPSTKEQIRIVKKYEELMSLCDQLEQHSLSSLDAHQQLVETLLTTLTDSQNADELAENWARISEHFDTLFTTEASIDALKQTILQLAVMGKLVPQDPNDEPASELLKRIAQEKAQLVKDGKMKKQKPLPPISDEEKPFELPDGWVWCRVSEVAMFTTSGSRDWAKYYSESGALFVTMGNLSKDSYDLRMDNRRYVNPPENGEGLRTKLEPFDLIISITGDVGNLGLIPEDLGLAYINQHSCLLRFIPICRNYYFPELMRSPLAKLQFNAPQRGIKNSFRLSDVETIVIPLPPYKEQILIAEKIRVLMNICDVLRASIQSAQKTQLHLADALTDAAIN